MRYRIVLIFLLAIGSSQGADTMTVDGIGWGSTHRGAVDDAIRAAVETSTGMLFSSNTVIDNYAMIKDIIFTSANTFCYRYTVVSDTFNANTRLYGVKISACISTRSLLKELSPRVTGTQKIDHTDVDRIRFELAQQKERAKNAVMFYANYIQNTCRQYLDGTFDSVRIMKTDVVDASATVRFHYTLCASDSLDNYVHPLMTFRTRAMAFAQRRYSSRYVISFALRSYARSDGRGWYDDDDPMRHSYSFTIGRISWDMPTDEWFTLFPATTNCPAMFPKFREDARRFLYPFESEMFNGDSASLLVFQNVLLGRQFYVAKREFTFDTTDVIPRHYRTLGCVSPNVRSNNIDLLNIPVTQIRSDMVSIELSAWVDEFTTDGKYTRSFEVIYRNKDRDLRDIFAKY